MKKTVNFACSLFFIFAILIVVSCGGGGGSSPVNSKSKIIVTYNTTGSKATQKNDTVEISSTVADDTALSKVSAKTSGTDNIVKLEFVNVSQISWSFSMNKENSSLETLVFDSALKRIKTDSFYFARGLQIINLNSSPVIEVDAFFDGIAARFNFSVSVKTSDLKNFNQNYSSASINVPVTFNNSPNSNTKNTIWFNEMVSPISSNEIPTREGYVFEGYFTAETSGEKIFDEKGALVKPSVCIDENGKWISLDYTTLYAHWSELKNYYTVIFKAGEDGSELKGTGTMNDQRIIVGEGVALNKCTFTPPGGGYTFKRWKKAAGVYFNDMETVNNLAEQGESVTLYAEWEDGYTITYYRNINAEDTSVIGQKKLNSGTTDTVWSPDPQYYGKQFFGWFTDRVGTRKFNPDIAYNVDTAVYAKWIGVSKYIIKFDPNGSGIGAGYDTTNYPGYVFNINKIPGTVNPVVPFVPLEDLEVEAGKGHIEFSKRHVDWVRAGTYRFEGWSTNKDASVPSFPVKTYSTSQGGDFDDYNKTPAFESFLLGDNATVTLYAVWYDTEKMKTGGNAGLEEQRVNIYFPNVDDPEANGQVFFNDGKKTSLAKLFMVFSAYSVEAKSGGERILGRSENTSFDNSVGKFYYESSDGNTDYYLDGYFTEKKGGYKILNADGSFYGTETLDKGQDNGYVLKDENGKLLWIGGSTTLYSHWEKN